MSHKAIPTETFDRILSSLPAGVESKDEDAEKKKSGGARKMFRRVSNVVRATGGVKPAKEKGKDRVEKEDREEEEGDKDNGRKSGDDSGDDKGHKKVHFK